MADEKPQIPPPRFPVREFTTPNFADGFYTEAFKRTDPAYMAVQVPKRGTLYSTIQGANPQVIAQFPNLYFAKEIRAGNSHEWVLWIWASDPAAEDSYNANVSYSGDATSYPIYQRVRTVRRDVYENSPTLTPLGGLTSLIAVDITAAGSNYTHATGTTGTGATVTFVCAAGQLIAGIVTNCGTGCTSGGAITITGDGSGATATAIVQPTGAKLVSQKKLEFSNESPLRNEYVQVLLNYETLPGPILWKPGFNTEFDNATSEYRQRVALPASPTPIDTVIVSPGGLTQYVVDSYVEPGESTNVGTKVTIAWSLPPSKTEFQSIGYEFPAIYNFLGPWVVPATPFHFEGPYPGVNYTLTAHRTLSTAADTITTYTDGPTGLAGVIIWSVTTPGRADRFFGIGPNTIHSAIFIQETVGFATQIIEDLPASTPSSYTPGDVLIIRASERQVIGNIYEQKITTCHE